MSTRVQPPQDTPTMTENGAGVVRAGSEAGESSPTEDRECARQVRAIFDAFVAKQPEITEFPCEDCPDGILTLKRWGIYVSGACNSCGRTVEYELPDEAVAGAV